MMSNDYEVVSLKTPLQTIQNQLMLGKTIFVSDDDGNIVSIVTFTDIVGYIAGA